MAIDLNLKDGSTITFHAQGDVLSGLATHIKEGINQKKINIKGKINVFVGIHELKKYKFDTTAINIGIQTEHYLDFTGRPMWMAKNASKLVNGLINLDIILDLSEANRPLYEIFPFYIRKPKIIFGPYIFPSEKIQENPSNNNSYVFVGHLNTRRKEILEEYKNITIKTDSHYSEIKKTIDLSAGVINIHFSEGIYTEWPRLLLAYLSGKAVVSERLGKDIIPHQHYQLLTREKNLNKINNTIYSEFSNFVVPKFSFETFLKKPEVAKKRKLDL